MKYATHRPCSDPEKAARRISTFRPSNLSRMANLYREDQWPVPVRRQGRSGGIQRQARSGDQARVARPARERHLRLVRILMTATMNGAVTNRYGQSVKIRRR